MFKHIIADKTGAPTAVNTDTGEDHGLVVATRPHKTFTTKTAFFANDTYGIEMAQDAAFGGGALLIHDGTDTGAWTMSEPTGTKWVADSTDRPYADAKSLKDDNSNVGDVMQVINNDGPGNDIVMTATYVATTFWINVDKDWVAGDSVSLYAHLNGALVGNAVLLENYFDFDSYDIWHFVNIPLTDLGIESSSIDAFRIEITARGGGKSPKLYIDEWCLQTTGEPITYEVKPTTGTWFHVKSFQTTFVDAYNADNADSTMPHLSYNQILGMTPTAGYIFKRFQGDEDTPIEEARITNLMDLLAFPYSTITNTISDGTNTLITVTSEYPSTLSFVLKAEELDKFTITIEDSFDDLLFFRVSLTGYEEIR